MHSTDMKIAVLLFDPVDLLLGTCPTGSRIHLLKALCTEDVSCCLVHNAKTPGTPQGPVVEITSIMVFPKKKIRTLRRHSEE